MANVPNARLEPDKAALSLTHWLYRRLYEIVRDAGPRRITPHDLASKLYAHRADGGPPSNCVKQVICARINPRIAKHGLMIRCGAGQSFYRLVRKGSD
jgi:hypothetical protein